MMTDDEIAFRAVNQCAARHHRERPGCRPVGRSNQPPPRCTRRRCSTSKTWCGRSSRAKTERQTCGRTLILGALR
jgi:hypothetical protein